MRRVASVPLVVILLGALVGPASAAGRIDVTEVPFGTYDFTITSDIGCVGFDVLVEDQSGRIFEIDLGVDRRGTARSITTFNTVTRYTRVDTGTWIERPFDSYGLFVTKADGSLHITGIGDILIWGIEPPAMGLTDGVWLIENGFATFQYDSAGGLVRAKRHSGSTFDVCAALS